MNGASAVPRPLLWLLAVVAVAGAVAALWPDDDDAAVPVKHHVDMVSAPAASSVSWPTASTGPAAAADVVGDAGAVRPPGPAGPASASPSFPTPRPAASAMRPPVVVAAAVLALSTSGTATVGDVAPVTLRNRSTATLTGQLDYDASQLEPVQGAGSIAFSLPPGGEQVVLLRVAPAAAGRTVRVSASGLTASLADGTPGAPVRVDGDGVIAVSAL